MTFIHPTKNLIPHVCGPQSSPLRSRLLAAAPRGNYLYGEFDILMWSRVYQTFVFINKWLTLHDLAKKKLQTFDDEVLFAILWQFRH